MKKTLFLYVLISFSLSCNNVNEPVNNVLDESFLNNIEDIVIPMNGISDSKTIIVNSNKFNIDQLKTCFFSSDTSIVDSSSIEYEFIGDSIYFCVKPKIFKFGETLINVVISDDVTLDSLIFKITITRDKNNDNYPTILFPLNNAELAELQKQCPYDLDKYGLLSFGQKGSLPRGQSTIAARETAVNLVISEIIKYSKFTNVTEKSELILYQALRDNSASFTDWWISFEKQNYEGLDFFYKEISALVKEKVVYLSGHYYNNLFVPEKNIISPERIKDILVGKKFEYWCWEQQEIIIKREIIMSEIKQVIFQIENDESREFRVAWEVPISNGFDDRAFFYILVDVITGEILLFSTTFIC